MKETIMNQEKLAKLQAQVRIGGKVRTDIKRNIKTFMYVYLSIRPNKSSSLHIDAVLF